MRFRSALISLILVGLFLFGLDRAGVLSGPRALLGAATNPLQVGWARFGQGLGDRFSTLGQIGSLSQDNLNLRQENDQLKAENAKLSLLNNTVEALRQQLKVSADRHFKLESAQVLGLIPSLSTRQILLDRGSSNGISVGQVVIEGAVALGKITSVEAEKSTLQLLTDPSAQVLAKTNHGAKGLLIGQFQSSHKLTKILQEDSVTAHDTVLTSGEDNWPSNLVIGEVTKVTRQEGELFQEAEVKPALDASSLEVVFIILGTQ